MLIDNYPGIKIAILAICYDNGGVHRDRSETAVLEETSRWLSQFGHPLGPIDVWFAAMSVDDLDIVCCGDQDEADRIMEGAPAGASELLAAYFNEVC